MRAAVVFEAGGPEKLVVMEVPTPEVKPGWTLVRVRGFGINHSELFTRQGLSPSVRFPRILGIECVGEVVKTTNPVRLPQGQTVVSIMGEMGRAFDGGYAEYCLLPNEQVCPVAWDGDWATLAAIPETYYTAWLSLKNLRVESGNRLLVRGGTLAWGSLSRGSRTRRDCLSRSRARPDPWQSKRDSSLRASTMPWLMWTTLCRRTRASTAFSSS